MPRSKASADREAVRARSRVKKAGRRSGSEDGCLTGHPVISEVVRAYELGVMPEGGGYPKGFIKLAGELMGVTNHYQVLHICSGSVKGRLTLDWRPAEGRLGCPEADVHTPMLRWEDRRAHLVECPHDPPHARLGGSPCSVVGDARRLPFRDSSVRWVMADPPYGMDYAEELWRLGKRYPTPIVLLTEAARVLVPGGTVGFLHHVMPDLPKTLEKVGVYGIVTGPGYRIRALTVARKIAPTSALF